MNEYESGLPLDLLYKTRTGPVGLSLIGSIVSGVERFGDTEAQVSRVSKDEVFKIKANLLQTDEAVLGRMEQRFGEQDSDYFGIESNGLMRNLVLARDEALMRFFAFEAFRYEQLSIALKRDRVELIDDVMARVAILQADSLYPKGVQAKFQKAIEQYPVISPITSLESGAGDRIGYCSADGDIALTNQYENVADMTSAGTQLKKIHFHEYVHAAGFTSGTGYMRGVKGNGMPFRWLEEAVVHHASVASSNPESPQSEVMNPDMRAGHNDDVYFFERLLASIMIESSDGRLSADKLVQAGFSEQGSALRDEVATDIDKALAPMDRTGMYSDMGMTLSMMYETQASREHRAKLLRDTISVLRPDIVTSKDYQDAEI